MNDALENGNRIMGNLVWRAISSFHIRVCLVALTAFGLTTVDTTYGQLRFRGEQEPLQMNGPLPPEFNPSTQPAELDFSATPIAMQNSIQEIQFHEVDPEIPDATEEADLTSDSSDELPQPDQPSTATMEFGNGTLGVPSDQEFSIYANQQQPLLYSTNDAFRRGHYYAKADIVMMLKSQVENVLVAVDAYKDEHGVPEPPYTCHEGLRRCIESYVLRQGKDITGVVGLTSLSKEERERLDSAKQRLIEEHGYDSYTAEQLLLEVATTRDFLVA